MKLAKPCMDVGLLTTDPDRLLPFWREEIGLPYEERLETTGGSVQHRLDLLGSVLKINRAPASAGEQPPGGYRELRIARPGLSAPRALVDPDGNRVTLVPPSTEGVVQIGIVMAVRDAAAFDTYFGRALELERLGPGAHRCGETLLLHHRSDDAVVVEGASGLGYRYLTLQIFDCEREHAGILARGGDEGLAPTRLRDVARFSMASDPDGNWIEISQRASLTGPLD